MLVHINRMVVGIACTFLILSSVSSGALEEDGSDVKDSYVPAIEQLCLNGGEMYGLWEVGVTSNANDKQEARKLVNALHQLPVSSDVTEKQMSKTSLPSTQEGHCWTMLEGKPVFMSDMENSLVNTAFGFCIVLVNDHDFKRNALRRASTPGTGGFVPRFGMQMIRLAPVNEVLLWGQNQHPLDWIAWRSGIYYAFAVQSNSLDLWLYQGSAVCGFRYAPKAQAKNERNVESEQATPDRPAEIAEGVPATFSDWKLIGAFPVKFHGNFTIVYSKEPLALTAGGEVYRLTDGMAERITSVFPTGESSIPEDASSEEKVRKSKFPTSRRLVLLEDQGKKKYVLFQWAGEELTPLDVQDKDKQNIEPFQPVKNVDPKIIKAATVMLKQMEKDEQEVAEFKRELEAKKKAQAEEEAKKPKPQTLQERLQQN
ncbi:MAG: hypothetical protein JXN61_15985 [Sedimentisphaerales bacterium]|nr:hypothetical protein [Sedimentisphaerales bacterium]